MSKSALVQEGRLEFINVSSNEADSTVRCYIRGEFIEPELCASELTLLNTLADQFETVVFYINSPGGNADTLVELISIKERFKNSIGVVTGQASSAGSLLWASCDLRVVHPYASLMMHRESFFYGGKTKHHIDHATHAEQLFSKMSREIFSDILTEKEIEEITHSELYFTAEEMIERGVAITYEQFLARENTTPIISTLFIYDQVAFLKSEDGLLYPVKEFELEDFGVNELYAKYGLVEIDDDEEEFEEVDEADFKFHDEVVDEAETVELIDDYERFVASMEDTYGKRADV